MNESTRSPADFAALHRPHDPLLLPNVWDVETARRLVAAGFQALGTTSLGVAAAAGLPDATGAAGARTIELTARLQALGRPVTADIEAGSADLAEAVARAGAAGVNIEDSMRPTGDFADLIRSVKRRVPNLFVNARTDTHWQRRGDLAETLSRVRTYARAGADGVFVPGLTRPEEIAVVVAAVDVPVNVLFSPGRHTVADLAALGVRRVSMGSLLFRAATAAAVDIALAVREGRPISSDLPAYGEIGPQAAGPAPA